MDVLVVQEILMFALRVTKDIGVAVVGAAPRTSSHVYTAQHEEVVEILVSQVVPQVMVEIAEVVKMFFCARGPWRCSNAGLCTGESGGVCP